MPSPIDSSREGTCRTGSQVGSCRRVVITAEEALAVPESALIQERQQRLKPTTEPELSVMAIISMILGIVGTLLVGILVGSFAIWFGILALRQIDGPEQLRGRGLALSGIALGAIDVILWLILILIYGRTLFSPHSASAYWLFR